MDDWRTLGAKVAITGSILFIVTTVAISLIGLPPKSWIAAPLVVGWFFGGFAALVGLLMMVGA